MHSSLQRAFANRCVLKAIGGLNNFDSDRVAATIKAADLGGATFVDIAADAALVKFRCCFSTISEKVDQFTNLCFRSRARKIRASCGSWCRFD